MIKQAVIFLILFSSLSFSTTDPSVIIAPEPSKKTMLTLWGEGWKFSVAEPKQWYGDSKKGEEFQANIIFYQKDHGIDPAFPLIRIRVNSKVDDNTKADLDYDMNDYKKKFHNVQFKDFAVNHAVYKCFQKLFFVPNIFYEYVVYMNLGTGIPWTLSISMNKQKSEASESELNAYREIISSIKWLIGNSLNTPEKKVATSGKVDFNESVKISDQNLENADGEKFDKDFAQSCGPWLVNVLKQCASGLKDKDLEPVTFTFCVDQSGNLKEVLVQPDTKLAECIKPSFYSKSYPKPPGPSWWVKMNMHFK